MSTLTTLKHRARVLAAAVALSAATLALSPSVAEATDTCTCTGGGSTGDSTVDGSNTNTSIGNVGQITGQDLVDVGDLNTANNNNVGANTPILSPHSDQSTSGNDQNVDSGASGSGSGQEDTSTNASKGNVGQVTLQDGVDVGDINAANNNNAGANTPIASPGSDQKTAYNDQNVDSGASGGGSDSGQEESNTNTSTGNVGQITGQDLVDVGDVNAANNNNAGLNTPVLSPDSDQKTAYNDQNVDSGSSGSNGGKADGGANGNTSEGNVIQATGQDLVDIGDANLANNNNVGLNAPVASPHSDQSTSGNDQSVDSGASGSGGGNDGQDTNTNTSKGNLGQITLQDGVDVGDVNAANNNNAGLNAPVLSPDSDQSTSGNDQKVDSGASSSGGGNDGQDTNTNTSTGNVGQVTGQDLADLGDVNAVNNNNAGANAPIASPGSDQSTSGNDQKVDSGSSGGSGSNPGDGGGNTPGDGGGGCSCDSPDNGGDSHGKKSNSGNGNGSEGGDPGNSEGKNHGGDEVDNDSDPDSNPGGNNNNDTSTDSAKAKKN